MGIMLIIGVIAVVSIITEHLQSQSKLKVEAMREEFELEKIKQGNYLLENEKMRLELEQAKQQLSLDYRQTETKL